jgi:hypothetical protein
MILMVDTAAYVSLDMPELSHHASYVYVGHASPATRGRCFGQAANKARATAAARETT